MTRNEINRTWFDVTGNAPVTIEMVQAFAALIAAAEREACARVCEQVSEEVTYQRDSQEAADKCGAAIRARGNRVGIA